MVEWCKQRARAQRWVEQVMLLRAEFERIVATDLWEAQEWEERAAKWARCELADFKVQRVDPAQLADAAKAAKSAPRDKTVYSVELTQSVETCEEYKADAVLKAGFTAYAHKQAFYRRERAASNQALWTTRRNDVDGFLSQCGVDGLRKEKKRT